MSLVLAEVVRSTNSVAEEHNKSSERKLEGQCH